MIPLKSRLLKFCAFAVFAAGTGFSAPHSYAQNEPVGPPPEFQFVLEEQGAIPGPSPPPVQGTYRLGAEGMIQIVVYGEPGLTGTYKVTSGGAVSIPLIGEVSVAGKTVAEAERLIAEKFSDGYLVDPSVTIQISQHRPVYVLGEVQNPGSYGYAGDMSVLNAVALAGGFTYRADRKDVEILRASEGNAPAYREFPVESKIIPGDIILVKERFF